MSIDYEKLKNLTFEALLIMHICPLSSIFGRKIANFGYRIVYSVLILHRQLNRAKVVFGGQNESEVCVALRFVFGLECVIFVRRDDGLQGADLQRAAPRKNDLSKGCFLSRAKV